MKQGKIVGKRRTPKLPGSLSLSLSLSLLFYNSVFRVFFVSLVISGCFVNSSLPLYTPILLNFKGSADRSTDLKKEFACSIPGSPYFSSTVDESMRQNLFLDGGYVVKQPVAWKNLSLVVFLHLLPCLSVCLSVSLSLSLSLSENMSSRVRYPARPIIFPRNDDRIHSPFTAVHYFDIEGK